MRVSRVSGDIRAYVLYARKPCGQQCGLFGLIVTVPERRRALTKRQRPRGTSLTRDDNRPSGMYNHRYRNAYHFHLIEFEICDCLNTDNLSYK